MVFSVACNCSDFIKKNKDVDLFKRSHHIRYERSSSFFKDNSKRIYNEIENCYYTLNEFAVFLLYNEIVKDKLPINKIRSDIIIETMKLFTNKKLKEDLTLLSEIYKQLKFKSINDYFKIREDGLNIAYHLIITKKISPIFYLRNLEKALLLTEKNDIMNCELMKFIRIAEKIKNTL